MRSSMKNLFCLSALLLLVSAPEAQDLHVYDGFDYGVTGTNRGVLNKKNGGFGWAGPWIGPKNLQDFAGWWKLDGDVKDLSPLKADGTLVGAKFSTDVPAAIKSWSTKSLAFAGKPDHVDLSAHVKKYALAGMGSISAWFKTAGTGAHVIVAASESREASREVRLFVEKGYLMYDVRGHSNSAGSLKSLALVNDGKWHHAAVTVDGHNKATLYLDGKQQVQAFQPFFNSLLFHDRMAIGRNVDSGGPQWFFTGLIDDVSIFGFVLSPAQVASLAQGKLPPLAMKPGAPPEDGPGIRAESLAGKNYPCGAFASRGFSPLGNRLKDNMMANRFFAKPLDMSVDATYYVSLLVRREDTTASPDEFWIRVREDNKSRIFIGWRNTGAFFCGGPGGFVNSTMIMKPKTTYFIVAKLKTGSSTPDQAFMKVFAPGDTVPASDASFNGMGTGANNWTVVTPPKSKNEKLNKIIIDPYGYNSIVDLDEIRVGTTWDSVTSLTFGKGCHGASIGQAGFPKTGSTSCAVTLSGGAPSKPAFLFLGLNKDKLGGLPLPLDLGSLGAPGCSLYLAPFQGFAATAGTGGAASFPVSIPNNPFLVGATLYWQWTSYDTKANALQLRFSDGLPMPILP